MYLFVVLVCESVAYNEERLIIETITTRQATRGRIALSSNTSIHVTDATATHGPSDQ